MKIFIQKKNYILDVHRLDNDQLEFCKFNKLRDINPAKDRSEYI